MNSINLYGITSYLSTIDITYSKSIPEKFLTAYLHRIQQTSFSTLYCSDKIIGLQIKTHDRCYSFLDAVIRFQNKIPTYGTNKWNSAKTVSHVFFYRFISLYSSVKLNENSY